MRTVSGPTDSVVIIGAGLGGLSAALHLAGAGRSVTVLEREALPGGRCGLIHDHGYRFDTGPVVLTMPEVIGEALQAVGEDLTDWLTLHRLDPAYRARFADGSHLDVLADPEAMTDLIAAECGAADAAGFRRFLRYLAELYRLEMPNFIERNLDAPGQLLGAPLARLARLGAFGRLAPKVATFVRDDRLRRIFTFQSLYAGLAPARALALYSVITYLDTVAGVYAATGGMHAVPSALAGAAAAHGVRLRYRTTAQRIEIAAGRARGVITTDGERIPADVVISNADLAVGYRTLLPPGQTPRRIARLRYSPSAVVLHAGSAATYPDQAHHTIHFGDAWDTTFDELIDRGEPMSDPSFLLTVPTVTDRSLAPTGRHVYYTLFPAPNLQRGRHKRVIDWDSAAPGYRDEMVRTLQERGYPGFGEAIECEHLFTPQDWSRLGLSAGTPFSAAHLFRQTGPFRPATVDPRIPNLVFCGAGTQPGVGVPMVLISGRLAAQRVTG